MLRRALLFALALFAGPALATNYFSWGAETANTVTVNGSSASIAEYKPATTRDCTEARSGSCSMKMVIIGNDGGNNGQGVDINAELVYSWGIVNAPALYYRWWMKIAPGFSWGSGTAKTKSSRVKRYGGAGNSGYTGYLMSYGFLIGECDEVGCLLANGTVNTDGNLYIPFDFRAMDDGQWHEYVVKVKPNTSASCTAGVNCDAELQAWVDGQSIGSYTGWKLNSNSGGSMQETWFGWMVYPYWQLNGTASDGGTLWIDDISTDDVWNSQFEGGDTTPPVITNPAPSDVLAYGTTSTLMTLNTNENATCKYGTSNVAYASLPNTFSTTGGTAHSTTLSSLSNGSSYTYYVRCSDATGNANPASTVIAFSVSNNPGSGECSSDWAKLHPTWIWCDDFETDKLSNYFDTDWTYFARSANNGREGSYSMRATYNTSRENAGSLKVAFGAVPAGAGMNIPTGVSTTAKYTEIYYRFYLNTPSGWTNPSTGSNSKLSRATSIVASDWSQAMIAHLWSDENANQYLRSDPVRCVLGSTVMCSGYNDSDHNMENMVWLSANNTTAPVFSSPYVGTWVCIEHHVKLNAPGSTDGVSQVWINGVEQINTTGLNFVGSYTTYAINALFLENYINNNSPANQVRDWDNLVIATARIGCMQKLRGPGNPRWRPADAWHLWFAHLETLH